MKEPGTYDLLTHNGYGTSRLPEESSMTGLSCLQGSPDPQVVRCALESAKEAAVLGLGAAHGFLLDPANKAEVECALRIRAVENALYGLFGLGKLHGTIHTCVGQEFSGAILSKHLRADDFVTSNHRCHGHFIGATANWRGLIDELVGNEDGVCAGIGSSQHLWARNFMSNGQQGGLLPVAAGIALDRKMKDEGNVVVSFIGEGTLGEGILYETLNLDALWDLPHVIICENNFYSQSTVQERAVSGVIADRARSFSITSETVDTWDLPTFDAVLGGAIGQAREESRPAFLTLKTYRLNPHSKGDDTRDRKEVDWFRDHDPATLAVRHYKHFESRYKEFAAEAAEAIQTALAKRPLASHRYLVNQLPAARKPESITWTPLVVPLTEDQRIAQQLNAFYNRWLARDESAFFLGEDIADPYGGAFKIARDLTHNFAARVRTTPISEAGITGMGIGLAISGRRTFVEIMFGDFITYAFDQIINNASKIFHMYNQHLECPVIIRTPMGARRGYGPTHSQSLERFLIGVDNSCTISLNSLAPVSVQLAGLEQLRCPVILLENKSDYTAKTFSPPRGFAIKTDAGLLPTLRIHPEYVPSTVTLLTYGGMARFVADALIEIFERTDALPEMIVPISISPLTLHSIAESVKRTKRLIVIEEGCGYGSVGAEIVAQLNEYPELSFTVRRISAKPTPIPSAPSLEAAVLPSIDDVCAAVVSLTEQDA
jgi:2-oxoisovalerate dehydrogenase E1 component